MFLHSYTGSDSTTWPAAKEIMDKFEQLASEEESISVNEDDIYHKIVGPDRNGHVRGYGYGPTSSSVFGCTPGRIELATQLAEANKQNEIVNTKFEDMRLKMEEDMKKKDDDMREELTIMKEQNERMEMFMASFISSMRQAPEGGGSTSGQS